MDYVNSVSKSSQGQECSTIKRIRHCYYVWLIDKPPLPSMRQLHIAFERGVGVNDINQPTNRCTSSQSHISMFTALKLRRDPLESTTSSMDECYQSLLTSVIAYCYSFLHPGVPSLSLFFRSSYRPKPDSQRRKQIPISPLIAHRKAVTRQASQQDQRPFPRGHPKYAETEYSQPVFAPHTRYSQ